nr:hypothetical protein [Marispirochaeta aestuarii]
MAEATSTPPVDVWGGIFRNPNSFKRLFASSDETDRTSAIAAEILREFVLGKMSHYLCSIVLVKQQKEFCRLLHTIPVFYGFQESLWF